MARDISPSNSFDKKNKKDFSIFLVVLTELTIQKNIVWITWMINKLYSSIFSSKISKFYRTFNIKNIILNRK